MNFLHMNFKMISSFENLTARFTGVRNEATLVLVANVPQQRAFQVKHAGTDRALELGSLRSLAHSVHRVSVRYSLETGRGGVAKGRGGLAKGRRGLAHGRTFAPTSCTSF